MKSRPPTSRSSYVTDTSVDTDDHADVTGRTNGRGYTSRGYFDRPQVMLIPPHLCWLSLWARVTQSKLLYNALRAFLSNLKP